MWSALKKKLSHWNPLANILAEVVFEAPPLRGQSKRSMLQWRVKRRADGKLCISLKTIGEYGGGPDGSVEWYIDFSHGRHAQLVAEGLALCMAECERLEREATSAQSLTSL